MYFHFTLRFWKLWLDMSASMTWHVCVPIHNVVDMTVLNMLSTVLNIIDGHLTGIRWWGVVWHRTTGAESISKYYTIWFWDNSIEIIADWMTMMWRRWRWSNADTNDWAASWAVRRIWRRKGRRHGDHGVNCVRTCRTGNVWHRMLDFRRGECWVCWILGMLGWWPKVWVTIGGRVAGVRHVENSGVSVGLELTSRV